MKFSNTDSKNQTDKSVCIVGAGQSGLASIKECVAQGLNPTCYELDSDLGGVWRPRDPKEPSNVPAIWPSFITNTSKWANAFSDFDALPSQAPFQTQRGQFEYYQQVASHFKLHQYIQFNTRVIWIRKTKDHQTTGRWEVFTCPTDQFRNGDKRATTPENKMAQEEREELLSKCKKETFDCIMICSGYFKYPLYPDIEGMSTFQGEVHHTFNYSDHKIYEGKRVLVVGNRFSGLDVANDVATVAEQTYIAVGRGAWIVPRVYPDGRTIDQVFPRELLYSRNSTQRCAELITTAAQSRLDHVALGIAPKEVAFAAPIGMGDDIVVKIMSGRIQTYGRLAKLTSRDAYFNDGNVIKDLDSIIFATGYGADLSFLDTQIMGPDGKMELYKMVFPVHEVHPTLALVGICASITPMSIVCEMQARLATRIFAGRQSLPSKQEMNMDADFWNNMNWSIKKSYSYFLPGTVVMDEIAKAMGVYPSFWKLLPKDPLLAYRVWYQSVVGAHYRLVGPDSNWEEARKTSHALYEERLKCIRNITSTPNATNGEKQLDSNNDNNGSWRKILSYGVAASAVACICILNKYPTYLIASVKENIFK